MYKAQFILSSQTEVPKSCVSISRFAAFPLAWVVVFPSCQELGKPRFVIPVRFGVFWPERAKKPETDWDDKPGKPRLVIPVRFGVCWPKKGTKKPKLDWDDKPGKPRLVIPVRFRVFWPKSANKMETNWDHTPGKVRLVIPVGFRLFEAKRGTQKRNGAG